jgi:hypothetical protein
MAQIIHNIDIPDSGNGDQLRTAFDHQNQMNTELYDSKVDKVLGKDLSSNDYTITDKNKLDGIEEGAEVNVQANWNQNDDTQDDFIIGKPEQLFSSLGYFHHNDTATQTIPLTLVANVEKKITNNSLGAQTNLTQAPYGVTNVWNSTTNSFDFSELSIGDTIDLRIDLLLTTLSNNQKYSVILRVGQGSTSQYDLLITEGIIKSSSTNNHLVGEVGLSLDYAEHLSNPANLYIVSDHEGSVKVNGFYTKILRKGINIVTIGAGIDLQQVTDVGANTTNLLSVYNNDDGSSTALSSQGVDFINPSGVTGVSLRAATQTGNVGEVLIPDAGLTPKTIAFQEWVNDNLPTPTLQEVTDEDNTISDTDYSQNIQSNANIFNDLNTNEQITYGIDGITKNEGSGLYNQQVVFDNITQNGVFKIPNETGIGATREYVVSLGYWVSVNATNLVAGISKLYNAIGTQTDGGITPNGVFDALNLKIDKPQLLRATSNITLTATTGSQKLFGNLGANGDGSFNVEVGRYKLDMIITLTNLAGSGSIGFITGLSDGTSAFANILMGVLAMKGSFAGTSAGSFTRMASFTSNTAISGTSSNTNGFVQVSGEFSVTTAGKLFPGISLNVSATPDNNAGSFCTITKID